MTVTTLSAEQLQAQLGADLQIMDVRDQADYARGHIPGALHICSETLEDVIQSADMDAPVVVYCHHGIASIKASELLTERGFDEVFSLNGGFENWRASYPAHIEAHPTN